MRFPRNFRAENAENKTKHKHELAQRIASVAEETDMVLKKLYLGKLVCRNVSSHKGIVTKITVTDAARPNKKPKEKIIFHATKEENAETKELIDKKSTKLRQKRKALREKLKAKKKLGFVGEQ